MTKYKSEACAVVHDLMSGLCEDGLIAKEAMKEFDGLCLEQSPTLPEETVKTKETGPPATAPVTPAKAGVHAL